MNFSQCGDLLNITRDGARKMILRNEKALKKYLIYRDKKVVGITDEGIEPLRNMQQRRSTKQQRDSIEITKLKLSNDYLQKEVDLYKSSLAKNEIIIGQLQDEISKLKAVLEQYQNLSFFERLLGYKKR